MKVCIISLPILLLLKGHHGRVSGPMVDAQVTGTELKKRGHIIYYVCLSDQFSEYKAPLTVQTINGFKIYIIRNNLPIFIKLLYYFYILHIINADFVIQSGEFGGFTAILCKILNNKFMYRITSDALVLRRDIPQNSKQFSNGRFSLSNIQNYIAIMISDKLVVQTRFQQIKLIKNYGKRSDLLLPALNNISYDNADAAYNNVPVALWVGSISEVKRPQMFVKFAEELPHINFIMIAGSKKLSVFEQGLYKTIKEANLKLYNFKHIEYVSPEEIGKYFFQSNVLVNTSILEGFPNAFIQAWMNQTPVVTLNIDPDNIITSNQIGFVSTDYESLKEAINLICSDNELYKAMGKRAYQYALKKHCINDYYDEFEKLISN